MSLNYLATRFTCSWPWSTMVMLCDGRMVCGCADPYGKRVLGYAKAEGVSAIWTGQRATDLGDTGPRRIGHHPRLRRPRPPSSTTDP